MQPSKILLVDDQLSSLIAIEQILEELDAKILKATSAKEALMIMLKESVDCILLDVSMPDMDGFELLKTINSAPAHSKIPVIMVTGKVFSENESLRAYQYGAVDYLLKPLDSEIVYRKVSFIVQQAMRIKASDHMAAIMKDFEKNIISPLKNLLAQHTGEHAIQVDQSQLARKKIDSALSQLNQLNHLWKRFDNNAK